MAFPYRFGGFRVHNWVEFKNDSGDLLPVGPLVVGIDEYQHRAAGAQHDGVGFMQHSIKNGRRHSAYVAFIKPILNRPNLTVMTEAHVQRVLFEGKVATGVEILRNGRLEKITAAREVILSGGAINTAQLLMLSGVGDAAALAKHGIASDVEVIPIGKINEAYERMLKNDVRYRFVIDMASLKS